MKFNIDDKVIINNHSIAYIVDGLDPFGKYGVSCVNRSHDQLHTKYDIEYYSPEEITLCKIK